MNNKTENANRPVLVNLELEDLPDSHTAIGKYIDQLERTIEADQLVKANAKTDKKRLDWLGDPENKIGNVMLPIKCIEAGLIDGLRGAIDEAMKMEQNA